MPTAAIPYVILLGSLFGSTLVASRFSVGQYHPTNYIAIRLVLASLGHLGLYVGFKRFVFPRDRSLWLRAGLLGIIGTALPMTAIVSSMQYQSSGLTAILTTAGPAITVIMAHFWLPDEPLSWRKSMGVSLALGGAVLLVVLGESGLPDIQQASPMGYLLAMTGVILGSASNIYIRRKLDGENSFDVSSIRMFTAALVLLPAAAFWVGFDLSGVNAQGYWALGYAALMGTFLGQMLVVYLVQRFGATASAMAFYVIPVIAAVGGALVLDEVITPGMIGGMILIVAGVAIINSSDTQVI